MSDKREVTLLWLYDDLLDLYGDRGNMMALQYIFAQNQINCVLRCQSLGDALDFDSCDFVYMGPGKARNLQAATQHLRQYRPQFMQAVQRGVPMLFCGGAVMALGQSAQFAAGRPPEEGMGLFAYTTADSGEVFVSDVTAIERFTGLDLRTYGFVNRTAAQQWSAASADRRFCQLLYTNRPLDCDPQADSAVGFRTEGAICNNLLATWQLGPLLVKNPGLARHFAQLIAGRQDLIFDDSLWQQALEATLREFSGLQAI